MGKGIRTRSGADPVGQWQTRIENFGSVEVSDALRDLLSGSPLVSREGVLEVSSLTDLAPNRHRISIRVPDAPYVADLVVTALAADAIPDPDARPSIPSPDSWMTASPTGEDITWELFNCQVHTLQSREN